MTEGMVGRLRQFNSIQFNFIHIAANKIVSRRFTEPRAWTPLDSDTITVSANI